MNKTIIDWCDWTWNPITGCLYECPYCYARKRDKRFGDGKFSPTFHDARLQEINKIKDGVVFIGSNGETFGQWVSFLWIDQIMLALTSMDMKNNKASFMFLTKNPARYTKLITKYLALEQRNIWLGTTLDLGYSSPKAPTVQERITKINSLKYPKKWVSIEPFAYTLIDDYKKILEGLDVQWIVIGFRTKPLPVLTRREYSFVEMFVNYLKIKNIPIFVKNSITDHDPRTFSISWPRAFPSGVSLVTKKADIKSTASPHVQTQLY